MAEEFLEKGRIACNEKNFYKAIVNYNSVIACAPFRSKQLALAYGCRACVYFETGDYAECLENIKLARDHDFPVEHMHQLEYRVQECKKLMMKSKQKFDSWKFFRLSYTANEKIPFIINALELCEDEKYGRHIITISDLETGEIIAIEEPIIKFLSSSSMNTERCRVCLKSKKLNLIPGPEENLFCSLACQDDFVMQKFAKENFTDIGECLSEAVSMAIRIAGGVDELGTLFSDGKPKTVFDFDFSDPNDPSYKKNLLRTACSTWNIDIPKPEERPTVPAQQRNIFSRLIAKIRYIFSRKTDERAEEELAAKEQEDFLSSLIDRLKDGFFFPNVHEMEKFSYFSHKVQCYGFGISSFSSLINHSCYPNVKFISFDNKIAIVVTRPIQAGEQIFTSYDNIRSSLISLKEREKKLAVYRFECDCIACVNKYPILEQSEFKSVSPGNAIRLFKENCYYIEKNNSQQPCQEISNLIEHNYHLLHCLAALENQFNYTKDKFH